jgi:bifunctional non-homologous end joining protein LigD
MAAPSKTLEAYRAKRDFNVTQEPSGAGKTKKAAKSGLSFVVQKHAARRLHYDFRLELDGVLKSWAVAKGPSLVPGEKRLAVHVEDHPLDYGGFEGTIPEGQYGAGSVIVWDRGVWTPEGDPEKGLAKGHLDFTLDGEKLKGRWHLVRMAHRPGERTDNWLLIKAHDEFAREPDDPDILEEVPLSVLSGKPVEAIASDKTSRSWTSGKPAASAAPVATEAGLSPRQRARAPLTASDAPARASTAKVTTAKPAQAKAASTVARTTSAGAKRKAPLAMPKAARKARLPDFIEPCLATAATTPPAGANFVHEIKFDGYRLQPVLDDGTVVIRTRRGLDWTERFPTIAEAIAALPVKSAIFDGEAVVEDQGGISDFAKLQDALKSGDPSGIVFYVFDLLYLDGYDLRAAPLSERKAALEQILAAAPAEGVLRYSAHFETNGETLLRHVCALSAEGIVSKRTDAPYQSGRSRDWYKAKCANRQELVVIGFAPSTATPKAIGSLALGYYEGGKLRYAGRAGSGYDADTARALFAQLEKLKRDTAPVEGALPAEARRGVRWAEPKLVAEIEFRGWTGAGLVRQAAFKALREDKDPREIAREVAVAPESSSQDPAPDPGPLASARRQPKARAMKAPETSVKLTHPDRVLWPEAGVTKQGLADYYALAWPLMAPHVAGRPLALLRCPAGISQGCFFQKHQLEGAGDYIVVREDPDDRKSLVGIDDFDGLIALVQASVLEIHPWESKFDDLEAPDRLIFDLDPGEGVEWSDLVRAAREVRARLKDDGLESFVKTSGGKGLHVVAPIAPRSAWADAKAYCRAVAEALAAAAPDRLTATVAKRERSGRIYIDYLRNARGATAVAAYSTRARPEAGVSTPLAWSELDRIGRGDHFTLNNIDRRLQSLRADPWAGMAKAKQALPAKKLGSQRQKR